MADLIDREEIADQVYKGTYTPLYSYVPEGLTGAIEPLKEMYGDGRVARTPTRRRPRLEAAGVTTPVALSLQYSNDHYGPSSGDEYALIKDQLESSGLFTVDLQTTEWVQYSKQRTADAYPAYQLGWFPDYSDADNYLTPFFLTENFLSNHYANQQVNDLILQQASTADPAERTALIEQIQELEADDLSTVPYLQGAQVAVVGTDVAGHRGHPRRVVQVPLRRPQPRADRSSAEQLEHTPAPGDPRRAGHPGSGHVRGRTTVGDMTTTTTELTGTDEMRRHAAPAAKSARRRGRPGHLPADPLPADLPDDLHPGDDGVRPDALHR